MKQTSAVRRNHVQDQAPALAGGGDVEKHQLVGPGRVIGASLLDRIAGIAQGDEIDALDHPPVLHVEAGNDPGLQHQAAATVRASAGWIVPA
jgi:hypothetical protein